MADFPHRPSRPAVWPPGFPAGLPLEGSGLGAEAATCAGGGWERPDRGQWFRGGGLFHAGHWALDEGHPERTTFWRVYRWLIW